MKNINVESAMDFFYTKNDKLSSFIPVVMTALYWQVWKLYIPFLLLHKYMC